MTKNSEMRDAGPIGLLGTQPPLGVDVAVSARKWKIIVALPVLSTVTPSELGVRLAEVSWNRVIHQIADGIPFPPVPQLFLHPMYG